MPLESVALSNPLILCRTLLCLPSVFPSVRVFSKESALHVRWPKYWSFSFGNSYQCVDSKKEQGAVGKVFQRSAPEATNCAFLLSLDLGAAGAFRLEFPLTASPHCPQPFLRTLTGWTAALYPLWVSGFLLTHFPAWGATGTRGLWPVFLWMPHYPWFVLRGLWDTYRETLGGCGPTEKSS